MALVRVAALVAALCVGTAMSDTANTILCNGLVCDAEPGVCKVEMYTKASKTMEAFKASIQENIKGFGRVEKIEKVETNPKDIRLRVLVRPLPPSERMPTVDGEKNHEYVHLLVKHVTSWDDVKMEPLIPSEAGEVNCKSDGGRPAKKAASSGSSGQVFKKKAAQSHGASSSSTGGYSDPYAFPDNWASWGDTQSWSNWPSHGSWGNPEPHPYYPEKYGHHDDDDDDDGRRTIKIIIVILVILVQIGLVILIAVCIKHYCCSDSKQSGTAPAQQQQLQPMAGQRTAVVTPIHIIHGAPVASMAPSPVVMQRALSTPVPPGTAIEVPGPAYYQAPTPQQLRRATSLTAIIA